MANRNRGKQSSDDKLFAKKWHPIFKEAVDDLCFLLTRGYAMNSALQLVGNRYQLNHRQRNAISRISSSDTEIVTRQQSSCHINFLQHKNIAIDGFNLLILLESALSGAYIFKGRDTCYRDISSVHSTYKRVMKTEQAILLIKNTLEEMQVHSITWYLDQPISNSGRLKTKLMEISEGNWNVELVYNPDTVLAQSKNIVISSDGWILNQVQHWFNLGAYIIEHKIPNPQIIEV